MLNVPNLFIFTINEFCGEQNTKSMQFSQKPNNLRFMHFVFSKSILLQVTKKIETLEFYFCSTFKNSDVKIYLYNGNQFYIHLPFLA